MSPEENKHWWNSLDDYWKRYFKIRLDSRLESDRAARDLFEPGDAQLVQLLAENNVSLESSSIHSLSPLAFMPQLKSLSCITMPQLKSLSDLPPQLEHLYLRGSKVTSLVPLSRAKDLSSLTLAENAITSLDGIGSLPQLRQLLLSEKHVTDLSPLAGLSALEALSLEGMAATGMEAIGALKTLKSLSLENMSLPSFDFLKNLPALESLCARRLKIGATAGMNGLPKLSKVELGDCVLDDLSFLAPLSGLVSLNIKGSKIKSLAPLASLLNLQELHLTEADLAPGELEHFKTQHPNCRVHSERDSYAPFVLQHTYEVLQNLSVWNEDHVQEIAAGSTVTFTGFTYSPYEESNIYRFLLNEKQTHFTWSVYTREDKKPEDYFRALDEGTST